MNDRPFKLAVIGDPIAHSKSPEIHRGFLAAAGIAGTYEAIRVPAGDGARAIAVLRADGYHGLNVTTPLKEEAWRACDRHDEAARASGSVNTIVFAAGETLGCTTDGIGLVRALRAALGGADLAARRVLLLGAGPTARAGAAALAAENATLTFWNRTEQRARALADLYGGSVSGGGGTFDVAVSTLPPGADLDVDLTNTLRATTVVMDANYGPRATLGATLGRPVHDGLAMLHAQAEAAFALWIARRP